MRYCTVCKEPLAICRCDGSVPLGSIEIDEAEPAINPFSPSRFRGDLFGVAAVMRFAREYPWSGPIETTFRRAAERVVEGMEPLHPVARVGLLAALETSARNATVGGGP